MVGILTHCLQYILQECIWHFSDISKVFFGRPVPHGTMEGATMVGTEQRNFQGLCLQILYKCTLWLWLFLNFFVKHFVNYLVLLTKNFSVDNFLKKSYIQIKNLYGYKIVRAWSDLSLKDAASSTEGITRSSVSYLCKRKNEYSRDLLRS